MDEHGYRILTDADVRPLENDVDEWGPEYMNGWESMMPAYYLSIRMMFHGQEKPEAILDDLWTKFYGSVAVPMASALVPFTTTTT